MEKNRDYWDMYWFTPLGFSYPRRPWPKDYRPHLASVYVFCAGEAAVKVGVSINPSERLKQLQTGQDRPIYAYWAIQFSGDVAREVEKLVHKRLRELKPAHANGEWYYIAPETAVGVIERVVEEGRFWGRPDPACGMFRDEVAAL